MMPHKIIYALGLLCCAITGVSAQTASDRSAMEQALKRYFENYGNGLSGFPVTATLNSVDVNSSGRVLTITASERFGEQEFTPEVVRGIYRNVSNILPKAYREAMLLQAKAIGRDSLNAFVDTLMLSNYKDYCAIVDADESDLVRKNRLRRSYGNTLWWYLDN